MTMYFLFINVVKWFLFYSKLFWSDWNRLAPKIEWSNLDGSKREILVTVPNVNLPNSIAVLPESGELCFADAGTKSVDCIDTFSKKIRNIAKDLSYPFGLTLSKHLFYWTDWTTYSSFLYLYTHIFIRHCLAVIK